MDFQKRYEFDPKVDLLGSGVFSRIYKATDILLERTVVLKFFTAEASAKYQVLSKIKTAIKLDHPNLCKYYDVELLSTTNVLGETENVVVAIMEYMEAGSFNSYIEANTQHTDKLFVDILMGLAYLHRRGIIHGDLRPQNVQITMEDDEPVAKIIDYGITKLSDPDNPSSAAVMSTIEYMPPEHFNPKRYGFNGAITTNLDLWSFGLVVYETVTNNKLFGSVSTGTSEGEVMSNILYKFPLAQFNQLPRKYKEVVNKCIVKDAAERVQTAGELILIFEKHTSVRATKPTLNGEKKTPLNGARPITETSKNTDQKAKLPHNGPVFAKTSPLPPSADTHSSSAGAKDSIKSPEKTVSPGNAEPRENTAAREKSANNQDKNETNSKHLNGNLPPTETPAKINNRHIPEDHPKTEKPLNSEHHPADLRSPSTGQQAAGARPIAVVRIDPEQKPSTSNRALSEEGNIVNKANPSKADKALEIKVTKTGGEGAHVIPPKEPRIEPEPRPATKGEISNKVPSRDTKVPSPETKVPPRNIAEPPREDRRDKPVAVKPAARIDEEATAPVKAKPAPPAPLYRVKSNKKIQFERRRRRNIILAVLGGLLLIGGFFFLEKYLFAPPERPNSVAPTAGTAAFLEIPELVLVDGGTFQMGSSEPDAQPNEKPLHPVRIGSFHIGRNELTVREFSHFITETKYVTTSDSLGFSWIYKQGEWVKGDNINWTNDIYGKLIEVKDMDVPVIHVSWIDAMNYCKWLAKETKLPFRLPTEAEWEFAARGGNNSKKFLFSGSNSIDEVAWYNANSKQNLSKVGQKNGNELGLHDMSGNVMEWCYDYYNDAYYSTANPDNIFGPDSGTERVARGGSWFTPELLCRSTFRIAYPETTRGGNLGFRICRSAQ